MLLTINKVIKNLFDEAQKNGDTQYIYTLLRVDGININLSDEFIKLKRMLSLDEKRLSKEELLKRYYGFTSLSEPLNMIKNLINCILKSPYNCSPFQHLYKGEITNRIKPTILEKVKDIIRSSIKAKQVEFSQQITLSYNKKYIDACLNNEHIESIEQLKKTLQNFKNFISELLNEYYSRRVSFENQYRFYKLPQFNMLELLVNESDGLYGFKIHYPNGNSAIFKRHSDSIECVNIDLGTPLGFVNFDNTNLRDEWMVGKKRLYEIGLPGRYNRLCEWKPIIYPGKADTIKKNCEELSDDTEVQGAFFYMMCTGYQVIEFVISTPLDIPIMNEVVLGSYIHLWKCPPLTKSSKSILIYDCWFDLSSFPLEPDYIKAAIDAINRAVNRIAFIYDAPVNWCLKYPMSTEFKGCAKPNKEDLKLLDRIFRKLPPFEEDVYILEYSIDWYIRGKSSKNIFTKFLCFYISIESCTIAITEGKAGFGLKYYKKSRSERKEGRIKCIRRFMELYKSNPIKFVEKSYFDCVIGLAKRTRQITQLVFGKDNKAYKLLFKKKDGYSLSDIRSKLAHGSFTYIDKEHVKIVRSRLPEIEEISKEFLIRLIFNLKPNEKIPTWSKEYRMPVDFKDPRNIQVCSKESILQTKDWRIRPAWCL